MLCKFKLSNLVLILGISLYSVASTGLIQAQAGLSISIPEINSFPQENITIPITILGQEKLAALGFTLVYDQDILEFVHLQMGQHFEDSLLENHMPVEGIFKISVVAPQDVKGEGVFCFIHFKVIGESGEFSDLMLTDTRIYNSDLESIEYSFSPGLININKTKK